MKSTLALLAIALLCGVVPVYAQLPTAFTARPATDAAFMASSGDDLIQSLHLRRPSNSSAMEQDVVKIVESLPLGLPSPPAIWICGGCGTSSHPNLGIIVDIVQIQHIREQAHIVDLHALLFFIVAHEAAHQVQFFRYRKDLYALPRADRLYYEAQADILAGSWIYGGLGLTFNPTHSRALTQVLHGVYDLGGEEYALADHPSNTGRFLAVRTGLEMGFSHHVSSGDAVDVRRQIDLHDGESDLDFTLRIARRITRFNPIATLDLVQVTKGKITSWDENSDHPFVTYHLTYENRGRKALRVDMQVQCLSVPRSDVEDIFHMLQTSANYYTFVIKPGKRAVISGKLTWSASEDLMPYLFYPPDDLAMIEVHYADGTDRSSDVTNPTSDRMGLESVVPDVPTGDRNNYNYTFLNYLQASRFGYMTLRNGPGQHYNVANSDYFPSSTAIPGAIDSKVDIDRDAGTFVKSTLLRIPDANLATSKYNETVGLVRAGLAGIAVPGGTGEWSETAHNDNARRMTTGFNQGEFAVYVERSLKNEDNGQGVTPTFYYVTVSWTGTANGH